MNFKVFFNQIAISLKKMVTGCGLLLSCCSAFALSVPFQNISLGAYATLYADYSIGTHGLIFCYSNTTQNVRELRWTYQGKQYSSVIPQSLKNNPIYDGRSADANGTLSIQNQTNGTLSFSCQFGF